MKITHRMAVVSRCPKGGRDEYELEVETDGLIEVESIISIVEEATKEPIFQEALCQEIVQRLELLDIAADATDQDPPSGTVRLRGVHHGVRTECSEDFQL